MALELLPGKAGHRLEARADGRVRLVASAAGLLATMVLAGTLISAACPNGWTEVQGGRCYLWVSDAKPKENAASYCKTQGGALATIPDTDAATAVLGTTGIKPCAGLATSSLFWIGLTGPSSSKTTGWSWDNGDSTTSWLYTSGQGSWYNNGPTGGSKCGTVRSSCGGGTRR